MKRNGYFQLENKTDGLYLNRIMAMDGGYEPSVEDLISYCNKKSIPYDNVVALKNAYEQAADGSSVRISEGTVTAFSGWCEYVFDPDGMKAVAVLYPAMKGMPEMDMAELQADLNHKKVKFGLINENIQNMFNQKEFFRPVVIAVGQPPVDGYDAQLIYNFNTEIVAKPKVNEDGSVDFHQLDLINRVSAGDVVAKIIPENPGEPGKNIYGIEVKPKKVYRKVFKHGRNLKISEDGTELVSLVTGHVKLEGDKVFVSDEYDIPTDVCNITGDINFDGNVHIRGSVLAGFKVNAGGDIVVDGVVEGSELTAGGNIILQRGIQGMNKGVLTAGGNIAANFIENATVRAGGDVSTDAVLHSKVNARGNVEVSGKNGYLIGGNVRAGSMVSAKIIGSEMGTTTVISVGTDPELMAEIERLKKEITEDAKGKEKLNQILVMLRKKQEIEGRLDKDKVELLQKTMKSVIVMEQNLKEKKEEYSKLSQLVQEKNDSRIKVLGTIYPGSKLEIGSAILFIRDKFDYCQFVKKDADIVRINV